MTHVLFDVDEDICTITMNRPEVRNAVDGPMAAALREAFERFDEDPSLAVAIPPVPVGRSAPGRTSRRWTTPPGRPSSIRTDWAPGPWVLPGWS